MTASPHIDRLREALDNLYHYTSAGGGRSEMHDSGKAALHALAAELDAAHTNERHLRNLHDWRLRDLYDEKARAERAEAALAEAQRELSWERGVVVVDLSERLDAARKALREMVDELCVPVQQYVWAVARAVEIGRAALAADAVDTEPKRCVSCGRVTVALNNDGRCYEAGCAPAAEKK